MNDEEEEASEVKELIKDMRLHCEHIEKTYTQEKIKEVFKDLDYPSY